MQTIGERIVVLLDALGLKKIDLARRLKITSASVTTMCNGKTNPSGQTITMICKEFNVREEWLRTGDGEMFAPKAEDELEAIVVKHGLSPQFAVVLRNLLELPNDQQEAIVQFILDTAEALNKQKEDGTLN